MMTTLDTKICQKKKDDDIGKMFILKFKKLIQFLTQSGFDNINGMVKSFVKMIYTLKCLLQIKCLSCSTLINVHTN